MNPDVAAAIPKLVEAGILRPECAPRFAEVARGELVSIRGELRVLLYGGVLALTSGVGLLVKENLERIGPVTLAAAISLAAIAAFFWVARHAPPFSWGEVASPNLAFDYILLLAVLLAATDLAYIEVQFTPLGPAWSWHLLLVALLAAGVAFRYDSRIVFSLALSSFAAWRGTSVAFVEQSIWSGASSAPIRLNSLACGILFAGLGALLLRTQRKAHFDAVAAHFGWLLVLGALLSGLDELRPEADVWAAAALLVGISLAAFAFRGRRFVLLAMGILAAYIGLSTLVLRDGWLKETAGCAWLLVTAIAMIGGLFLLHRKMKEPL